MKKSARFLWVLPGILLLALFACDSAQVQLWNGKDFSGWKLFVQDDSVDVNDVWSVRDGVIYCTGVPNGYMRTESAYSDYILDLEWRWVEEAGNSGVLLHMQEPDRLWPNCIECQLKSGDAGDFVLMGAVSITKDDEDFSNSEGFLGIPKLQDSAEKPVGEWNTYKIICEGDQISCYVNDVLQNRGAKASLTHGKIGLQSEGAAIEFRNLRLELLH